MSDALNVEETVASVDAYLKQRVEQPCNHGMDITASSEQPEQGYSWNITVTTQPGTPLHDYLQSQQAPAAP